jgi:pilus assembly protein CpaF
LHRRLLDVPFDPSSLGRPELRARLARMLREEAPLLSSASADVVLDELVDDVGGLGPLEPLLADPTISEVMVNGPDRVFVERAGRIVAVDCRIDAATIVRVVERVIAPLGLRLDRASPMVDARLADGSRLHAVLPPLAPDGPCVSIRRFGARSVPLSAFGVDPESEAYFDALVRAGWNIVVSGATSSGKTTCCNALARAIDPTERIVTIEETAELRLEQPHVVRLEARPANAEGTGAVSVRDLVRSALERRSTCSRRATPATTVRSRPCTPTAPTTRWPASRRWPSRPTSLCRCPPCGVNSSPRSTRSCRCGAVATGGA